MYFSKLAVAGLLASTGTLSVLATPIQRNAGMENEIVKKATARDLDAVNVDEVSSYLPEPSCLSQYFHYQVEVGQTIFWPYGLARSLCGLTWMSCTKKQEPEEIESKFTCTRTCNTWRPFQWLTMSL